MTMKAFKYATPSVGRAGQGRWQASLTRRPPEEQPALVPEAAEPSLRSRPPKLSRNESSPVMAAAKLLPRRPPPKEPRIDGAILFSAPAAALL